MGKQFVTTSSKEDVMRITRAKMEDMISNAVAAGMAAAFGESLQAPKAQKKSPFFNYDDPDDTWAGYDFQGGLKREEATQ